MKLLKNNIKLIIGIIIGAILAGGITYAAISASEVGYIKDGTEIKNVREALNNLYNDRKETSNMTYDITENRVYTLDKYYKNLNVMVPKPNINIRIINDAYSTSTHMASMNLPGGYKYFKISELNKDSNVNSCSLECWSVTQQKWIVLTVNNEYEIASDTDGYKFGTVGLKTSSKTNSWSRSFITILLYN